MATPKVSIEELCRYIDGECAPADREDIDARLAVCPTSRAILGRLREITQSVDAALLSMPPLEPPAADEPCLEESLLAALSENRLPKDELARAEHHALRCPACFQLIMDALRSTAHMSRNAWPDLPQNVTDDPRLCGLRPKRQVLEPPADDETVLGSVVLDLGSEDTSEAHFSLASLNVQLTLRAMPPSSAEIDIACRLEDKPLGQEELTLWSHELGRKYFRALTTPEGQARVRRLAKGTYDLHLPARRSRIEICIR